MRNPTYADVVSTLALFLAVAGGTAVAQEVIGGTPAQPELVPGEQVVGGFSVDAHASAAGEDFAQFIPLGARSTRRIDTPDVMIDKQPGERCAGTAGRPSAPRGKLCLYVSSSSSNVKRRDIEVARLTGLRAVEDRGFSLGFTTTGSGDAYVQGVFAYRAP